MDQIFAIVALVVVQRSVAPAETQGTGIHQERAAQAAQRNNGDGDQSNAWGREYSGHSSQRKGKLGEYDMDLGNTRWGPLLARGEPA